jgi:hypothetical protein
MTPDELQRALFDSLQELVEKDRYLLEHDLSERCIASRLSIYLQARCEGYAVDVEYNRKGELPKRLGLPPDCANFRDADGESLVVPDLIVHTRGEAGPNLLVVELKKTTNADGPDCDRERVQAFLNDLGYQCGALVECETRPGRAPSTRVEWYVGARGRPTRSIWTPPVKRKE